MFYQNPHNQSSGKARRERGSTRHLLSALPPRATGLVPRENETEVLKIRRRVLVQGSNDSHWYVGWLYPGNGSTFKVRQEDENGYVRHIDCFSSTHHLREIPLEYLTGMQTYPALSEAFHDRKYNHLEFVWAAVGGTRRSGTAQLSESWVPAMYLKKESSSSHSVVVLAGLYANNLPKKVSRVRPYEG